MVPASAGAGKNVGYGLKAAGRTRTADLKITNHALFQLSYGGLERSGYVVTLKGAIRTPIEIEISGFIGAIWGCGPARIIDAVVISSGQVLSGYMHGWVLLIRFLGSGLMTLGDQNQILIAGESNDGDASRVTVP